MQAPDISTGARRTPAMQIRKTGPFGGAFWRSTANGYAKDTLDPAPPIVSLKGHGEGITRLILGQVKPGTSPQSQG